MCYIKVKLIAESFDRGAFDKSNSMQVKGDNAEAEKSAGTMQNMHCTVAFLRSAVGKLHAIFYIVCIP